jgi:hypothetical protein
LRNHLFPESLGPAAFGGIATDIRLAKVWNTEVFRAASIDLQLAWQQKGKHAGDGYSIE